MVSKTVDFTDLRVREFTKDEIHGNRDFLEVSEEMAEITFKIQVKNWLPYDFGWPLIDHLDRNFRMHIRSKRQPTKLVCCLQVLLFQVY